MDPINYIQDVQTPFQAALQGYQAGNAILGAQRQQQTFEQEQLQRQQEFQQKQQQLQAEQAMQAAYAELFFIDTLWPDFTNKQFNEALDWFSKRDRRFGSAAPF